MKTPIEPEKKKCPKTMSGEHFFYVANLFATNDPLYYAKSKRYPICSYCGIINDLKEDDE